LDIRITEKYKPTLLYVNAGMISIYKNLAVFSAYLLPLSIDTSIKVLAVLAEITV